MRWTIRGCTCSGTASLTLARRGTQAPDGNGKILNFGTSLINSTFGEHNIALNEARQVAFVASFTGATGGAVLGMLRADESSRTQIVRTGQLALDGVSKFDFTDLTRPR